MTAGRTGRWSKSTAYAPRETACNREAKGRRSQFVLMARKESHEARGGGAANRSKKKVTKSGSLKF